MGSLSEIRLHGLRKYTVYSLSVQVFNIKGKGNFSKSINVTTGEDSKLDFKAYLYHIYSLRCLDFLMFKMLSDVAEAPPKA